MSGLKKLWLVTVTLDYLVWVLFCGCNYGGMGVCFGFLGIIFIYCAFFKGM